MHGDEDILFVRLLLVAIGVGVLILFGRMLARRDKDR